MSLHEKINHLLYLALVGLGIAWFTVALASVPGCESPTTYNEKGQRTSDVKVGQVERQGIFWDVMVRPDGSAYLQSPWSEKDKVELVGVAF